MSNYIVAIPSYNRADVIVPKTLTTLKEGKVSKNKIYIFVANKQQEYMKNQYQKIYIIK
jgi:hypothetical protein